MVTGHRPQGIGGYWTPNPTEQWVRGYLQQLLTKLQDRHPDLVAVSGMALGTDTIFVEECVRLCIPFIAAVAFEGQESRWPEHSQDKYRAFLRLAQEVVHVDQEQGHLTVSYREKLLMRNWWMVDHADLVIAVWNGSSGGTAHAVKAAQERGRKIIHLNPKLRSIEPLT